MKKETIEKAIKSFYEQSGMDKSEIEENLKLSILSVLLKENEKNNLFEESELSKNYEISVDLNKGIKIKELFHVVESIDEDDPRNQILITDKSVKSKKIGDVVKKELLIKNFSPLQKSSLLQFFVQKNRESEKEHFYDKNISLKGELVEAKVHRVEASGLNLDYKGIPIFLPKGEMIFNDNFEEGSKIQVYIQEVLKNTRNSQIIASRKDVEFVKKILENEVSDVKSGIIKINRIVREAGSRTKIAVSSTNKVIDPVSAIIGPRGMKIKSISRDLNNERIDVMKFKEDEKEFLISALSPINILGIKNFEDEEKVLIVVDDPQIIGAIGKGGQNARMISELIDKRIEIKTLSEAKKQSLDYEVVKNTSFERGTQNGSIKLKTIEELNELSNKLKKEDETSLKDDLNEEERR